MKKILITINCCLGLGLGSCTGYLDIVPDNVATIEYIFRNRSDAYRYLATCYSYLPYFGYPNADAGVSGSDELWTYTAYGANMGGHQIARGYQNADQPWFPYWDGLYKSPSSVQSTWNSKNLQLKDMWEGIRVCNILLENIYSVSDLNDDEKRRWAAEAIFLKAFYHFYLFRNYGPIPIVDKNLSIDTPTEQTWLHRATVDECVEYIVGLFDRAVADLPMVILEGAEFGRVSGVAALSMKARVLLYAASPLFNGNPAFAGLTDNRGVKLFPQSPDPDKWKLAADACKIAIDEAEKGMFMLHHFDDIGLAAGMSDALRTQMDIREAVTKQWSTEVIWGAMRVLITEAQRWYTPRIDETWRNMTSCSFWSVPIHIAEGFYTKNGVPMAEDKTLTNLANNPYAMRTAVTEDRTYVKPGATTVAMHFDREPRFYASLAFDTGAYAGAGRMTDANLFYVAGKYTEYSGRAINSMVNYSETGYWAKKPISYIDAWSNNSWQSIRYPFPIVRLTDLYLMYSEALNETMATPNDDVFEYIDRVRERAGLKGVRESWTNYSTESNKFSTRDGMRDIIQQERLNEMIFESHRFWDIRRWGRLEEFMNIPVRGWNHSGNDNPSYYTLTTYWTRNFSTKDYFFPIRTQSLRENPNLVQNVGW